MRSDKNNQFIKQYYNALVNSPSLLKTFFHERAKLTVSKEGAMAQVYDDKFEKWILGTFRHPITKVMISTFDVHLIDDFTHITVIAQVLDVNSGITRFIESMVLDRESVIVSSIIRILNEHVVFEKQDDSLPRFKTIGDNITDPVKALCVKNGLNYNVSVIITAFKKYGKIVSYEKSYDNGHAFIEFENVDSFEMAKKDATVLASKGFIIDSEAVYPSKREKINA